MTDERDDILSDEEDKGVKIEIHGGDETDENLKETDLTSEAEAQQKPESGAVEKQERDSPDSGFDDTSAETDTPDSEDSEKKPAKPDSSDDSGEASSGKTSEDRGAEAGQKEEETASGKGFFGFRGKKEKDKKDQKIEELTDQLKRQMAEFDNFRKRTDREKASMFDMGKKDVIEQILPIVDSFERGLGNTEEESADPFRQGMQKIYKQLTKALEELGVRPIEAVGKPFDPNFHNAVMHCEDDSVGENIVVQELQKGYMLHDTVVRHSMVKVAN